MIRELVSVFVSLSSDSRVDVEYFGASVRRWWSRKFKFTIKRTARNIHQERPGTWIQIRLIWIMYRTPTSNAVLFAAVLCYASAVLCRPAIHFSFSFSGGCSTGFSVDFSKGFIVGFSSGFSSSFSSGFNISASASALPSTLAMGLVAYTDQ